MVLVQAIKQVAISIYISNHTQSLSSEHCTVSCAGNFCCLLNYYTARRQEWFLQAGSYIYIYIIAITHNP